MFATTSDSSSSSANQQSTISFRLKSSASTNLTVSFLGRDIKVADLKDKIAERLLSYSGGANLQLYETSGRLLSDGNERVPAFSEILVVRTNEIQAGSNVGGSGGGGGIGGSGGGGAQREKTAGALGTINAQKKLAQEASAMTRRAELDFGAEVKQTQHQKMFQATSSAVNQNNTGSNYHYNRNESSTNNSSTLSKSEEEKLQELQDIVGRDMGVGTATYGGRGIRGPYQQQNQQQSSFSNNTNFAAGKSLSAGGSAMAAAPNASYVCHLCGGHGHFIAHCPLANATRGGGNNNNNNANNNNNNNNNQAGGGGNLHHQRRFAQPTGIPESELEKCSPEDAMFITRDGHYVRRKLMGLGEGAFASTSSNTAISSSSEINSNNNDSSSKPIFKCMHCNKIFPEVKNLRKLPCNCEKGKIACMKCVDDGVCLEMSDDGPVCAKCRKEIDADEIVVAKIEDFPTVIVVSKEIGQRRGRE